MPAPAAPAPPAPAPRRRSPHAGSLRDPRPLGGLRAQQHTAARRGRRPRPGTVRPSGTDTAARRSRRTRARRAAPITLSTRSRAIWETRSRSPRLAAATSSRRLSGPCAMSASVSSRYSGPPRPCQRDAVPHGPQLARPARGSGSPGEDTVSGSPPCRADSSRASSPVPSALPSSTRKTSARPGYSWASSEGRLSGQHPGLVPRRHDDTDGRPGARLPSRRQPLSVRQKKP